MAVDNSFKGSHVPRSGHLVDKKTGRSFLTQQFKPDYFAVLDPFQLTQAHLLAQGYFALNPEQPTRTRKPETERDYAQLPYDLRARLDLSILPRQHTLAALYSLSRRSGLAKIVLFYDGGEQGAIDAGYVFKPHSPEIVPELLGFSVDFSDLTEEAFKERAFGSYVRISEPRDGAYHVSTFLAPKTGDVFVATQETDVLPEIDSLETTVALLENPAQLDNCTHLIRANSATLQPYGSLSEQLKAALYAVLKPSKAYAASRT